MSAKSFILNLKTTVFGHAKKNQSFIIAMTPIYCMSLQNHSEILSTKEWTKNLKDYFLGLDIPWPLHDWHTRSWQSQCWSCPSRSILWLSCLPSEYQRDQSCTGPATFLPKIHKAEKNSIKKWNLTVFSFLFNIIFKNHINFNSIILLLQF